MPECAEQFITAFTPLKPTESQSEIKMNRGASGLGDETRRPSIWVEVILTQCRDLLKGSFTRELYTSLSVLFVFVFLFVLCFACRLEEQRHFKQIA